MARPKNGGNPRPGKVFNRFGHEPDAAQLRNISERRQPRVVARLRPQPIVLEFLESSHARWVDDYRSIDRLRVIDGSRFTGPAIGGCVFQVEGISPDHPPSERGLIQSAEEQMTERRSFPSHPAFVGRCGSVFAPDPFDRDEELTGLPYLVDTLLGYGTLYDGDPRPDREITATFHQRPTRWTWADLGYTITVACFHGRPAS